MTFFDQKDLAAEYDKRIKLKSLQKSEKHLLNEITNTSNELDMLKTNAQTIEKYARERYMMKKDNEDLFIIKSPAENN